MNRSSIIVPLIACLLALPPLALKVSRYRSLTHTDPSHETGLTDFLARQRFEAVQERLSEADFFLIHARRDDCRMDLREVAPQGWDRAGVKSLSAGRQLYYVDNGSVSAEQPAWRTWAYFHLRRFASFLGWPIPKRLTFAVISSGHCARLNWSAVAALIDPAPLSAVD